MDPKIARSKGLEKYGRGNKIIDHLVIIGGEDVSADVLKISVQDSLDTDSDPGKMTIALANPAQKYTMHWPPQKTVIEITLYNWVYRTEEERRLAGGHSEKEYLTAIGTMTDLVAEPDEVIITGETNMGHLADALPKDYHITKITPKEILQEILGWHTDKIIELDWDDELSNVPLQSKTFDSYETYQDVVEDIRDTVNAVAYFSESDKLVLRDPFNPRGSLALDGYVTNPDQVASIMGYRNVVIIIGDEGEEEPLNAAHGSIPIIGTARDWDSIASVGVLPAPVMRFHNIRTQEQADAKALEILRFFLMYKNAETVVEVEGIVPPLQFIVSYPAFIPISDDELAKFDKILADRIKILQDIENEQANAAGRAEREIKISSRIRGIVINRDITYSIDGMHAKLTISPGLLDGEAITAEDVGGVLGYNTGED
ncbi:MAG: hypothetical protein ACYDHX_17410 [Methanothrix sp.]